MVNRQCVFSCLKMIEASQGGVVMIRGEVRYEADAGGLLPKFLYSCKQESYYADRKHLPLKYPLQGEGHNYLLQ